MPEHPGPDRSTRAHGHARPPIPPHTLLAVRNQKLFSQGLPTARSDSDVHSSLRTTDVKTPLIFLPYSSFKLLPGPCFITTVIVPSSLQSALTALLPLLLVPTRGPGRGLEHLGFSRQHPHHHHPQALAQCCFLTVVHVFAGSGAVHVFPE